MSVVFKLLLELKTIDGGWNNTITEKKDEAVTTSACRCLMAQYVLAEDPLFFAIPRNMELFMLQVQIRTLDCDKAHSKHQKRGSLYCVCFIAYSYGQINTHVCTLNAHFLHSIDRPLLALKTHSYSFFDMTLSIHWLLLSHTQKLQMP